jgi:hypothetical protein
MPGRRVCQCIPATNACMDPARLSRSAAEECAAGPPPFSCNKREAGDACKCAEREGQHLWQVYQWKRIAGIGSMEGGKRKPFPARRFPSCNGRTDFSFEGRKDAVVRCQKGDKRSVKTHPGHTVFFEKQGFHAKEATW